MALGHRAGARRIRARRIRARRIRAGGLAGAVGVFRFIGVLGGVVPLGRAGRDGLLGLHNAGLAVAGVLVLVEELVPVEQVNQQQGHQHNQNNQNGRHDAVGAPPAPAAGAPQALPEDGTAGNLLFLLPVLFLLAEWALFICIGISLPADGAAFHCHTDPPACRFVTFALYMISVLQASVKCEFVKICELFRFSLLFRPGAI